MGLLEKLRTNVKLDNKKCQKWTPEEILRGRAAIVKHGKHPLKISQEVGTRTFYSVRHFLQQLRSKLEEMRPSEYSEEDKIILKHLQYSKLGEKLGLPYQQ